jgi:hypothetical protein
MASMGRLESCVVAVGRSNRIRTIDSNSNVRFVRMLGRYEWLDRLTRAHDGKLEVEKIASC